MADYSPYITSDSDGIAGPTDTLTLGESQATTSQDDQYAVQDLQEGNNTTPAPAADSEGVGAGTTNNAYNSVNSDENPVQTRSSTQATVNLSTSTATLNSLIPSQPNQLDQYASYTYAISWYLLSPEQFNNLQTQQPNTNSWQLLMQSGGAPTAGRSPYFPLDYYIDDLEIDSLIPFGGSNMPNSAVSLRFKIIEPNGISLLENLFAAVQSVYKNAQQNQTDTTNNGSSTAKSPGANTTINYLQAIHCLVVEFYGYDSNGNLVAPVKGAFNTNSGYGQQAVVKKYYPFIIVDLKFAIANKAMEYNVTGRPIVYQYALTTDRGTVPFPFTMSGQTVDQLLNGPQTTTGTTATPGPGERQTSPTPDPGIAPAPFVDPVQATGDINQSQADTLNLLAAGQLGA